MEDHINETSLPNVWSCKIDWKTPPSHENFTGNQHDIQIFRFIFFSIFKTTISDSWHLSNTECSIPRSILAYQRYEAWWWWDPYHMNKGAPKIAEWWYGPILGMEGSMTHHFWDLGQDYGCIIWIGKYGGRLRNGKSPLPLQVPPQVLKCRWYDLCLLRLKFFNSKLTSKINCSLKQLM